MQNDGPKSLKTAQKAIILHTLGVQLVPPRNKSLGGSLDGTVVLADENRLSFAMRQSPVGLKMALKSCAGLQYMLPLMIEILQHLVYIHMY